MDPVIFRAKRALPNWLAWDPFGMCDMSYVSVQVNFTLWVSTLLLGMAREERERERDWSFDVFND